MIEIKIKVKGKEFEVRQMDFQKKEIIYADKNGKWYHALISEVEMFVKIKESWVKV